MEENINNKNENIQNSENLEVNKEELKKDAKAKKEELRALKIAEKQKIKEQKLQQRLDRANRNILWLWFLGILIGVIVLAAIYDNYVKYNFMKKQKVAIDSLHYNFIFYKNKYIEKDSAYNLLIRQYNQLLAENISKTNLVEKKIYELNQLQILINKQDSIIRSIKQKVEEALTGYSSDKITIKIQNGKLYVSFKEKLLFPSGVAKVTDEGMIALGKIAKVLKNINDVDIVIEGHTDNVPINPKNKQFRDNWDLSTARAVEVTRILVEKYNMRPERIIASGRSMYYPVAPNTTEKGRAQNRRIEFIISPNLDEIYKIVSSKNEF